MRPANGARISVSRVPRDPTIPRKRRTAAIADPRIPWTGIGFCELGLRLHECRLVVSRVDSIKRRPLCHIGSVRGGLLHKITGKPGPDGHRPHCLHPGGETAIDRNSTRLHRDDRHLHRRRHHLRLLERAAPEPPGTAAACKDKGGGKSPGPLPPITPGCIPDPECVIEITRIIARLVEMGRVMKKVIKVWCRSAASGCREAETW